MRGAGRVLLRYHHGLSHRAPSHTHTHTTRSDQHAAAPNPQRPCDLAARPRYMGSVIIGATTLQQLRDNIDACCMPLDAETEAAIDELYLTIGDANMQD